MSEAEKEDILFQIDMQLYDEFNDTIATMNDHLGDIYSLRDIEEVEKAEKYKEIKLLREAVEKQQKELDKKNEIIDLMADKLSEYTCWNKDDLNMNKLVPIKDIIDYFTNKADEQNG